CLAAQYSSRWLVQSPTHRPSSAAKPRLRLAPGPPCHASLRNLSLRNLASPVSWDSLHVGVTINARAQQLWRPPSLGYALGAAWTSDVLWLEHEADDRPGCALNFPTGTAAAHSRARS